MIKRKLICVLLALLLFLSISINENRPNIFGPWMQKENYDYWVENGNAHPYYMQESMVNGMGYKCLTRSYIIEKNHIEMPLFQVYSLIDIKYKKNKIAVLTVVPLECAGETVSSYDAKGTITMHFLDNNTVECMTETNEAWDREEFHAFSFAPGGIWVRGEKL